MVTYYLLLDHAVKLQAEQAYQNAIIALTPHVSKEDRKKILNSYIEIIDGKTEVSSAIIEKDRARLRKLLSPKVWQNQAQK